jgi:hypothetical protein
MAENLSHFTNSSNLGAIFELIKFVTINEMKLFNCNTVSKQYFCFKTTAKVGGLVC